MIACQVTYDISYFFNNSVSKISVCQRNVYMPIIWLCTHIFKIINVCKNYIYHLSELILSFSLLGNFDNTKHVSTSNHTGRG